MDRGSSRTRPANRNRSNDVVAAAGTGAEIMRPMAAPVLGGLLISDEVIDLMIPVLFYWIRKARWLKLHQEEMPNVQRSTSNVQRPMLSVES